MKIAEVRAEFARRAIQFHKNESLENIELWGLFLWGDVPKYIKDGRVIPNPGYTKINRTIWCRPSQKEIDTFIKPLIESLTLEELTSLAGWKINKG